MHILAHIGYWLKNGCRTLRQYTNSRYDDLTILHCSAVAELRGTQLYSTDSEERDRIQEQISVLICSRGITIRSIAITEYYR